MAWRLRCGGDMATERSDGAKRRHRRAYGEEDDAGLGRVGRLVGCRWAAREGKKERRRERGREGEAGLGPVLGFFLCLQLFFFFPDFERRRKEIKKK